jgi:hypothetical protein
MPRYGTAVVRERLGLDDRGEIARYVKWEYGEGTNVEFLRGWAAEIGPSKQRRRFEFSGRLGGLSTGIKARVAAKFMKGWRRELALLAQWKRGELPTPELINRLEELDREAKISRSSAGQ